MKWPNPPLFLFLLWRGRRVPMARKKRLRQGKQREPSPRTPLRQPKRKPHDPAYTPSQDATPQAPTSDYHSPNRNIAWREDIKPEAKKAVIEASPSHDACLVCQIANKYGKTTCAAHLIDKGLAGFEDLVCLFCRFSCVRCL